MSQDVEVRAWVSALTARRVSREDKTLIIPRLRHLFGTNSLF